MKQLLIIFFRAEGTKPWLVLACLLLASLSEAFGIGTLLPAANAVLGDSARETPGASQIVRTFIESLGISANLGNLLIISVALLTLKAVIAFIALAYAGILQLVAYAAVAVFVDWRIALLGAAAGAIITLTMSTRTRISNQARYKQTDRISSLTIEMVDMMNSIKALKSMDRCGLLVQGLSGLLSRIKRSLITIQLAKHGVTQGSDALVNIMIGAVAFGAYSLFGSTHPELLVTGIVFFQIVNNLTKLQKRRQTAVVVESSYVRTIELIKQAEGQKESHTGNVAPNLGAGCNFEGVTFAHGSNPIISNANFKMPTNIITVLQGPSGSGKTSLIDLLIGLNTAQKGRVLIGGRPIETIDIKAWRQSIGYVPRELMLFRDTIHENIGLSNLDLSAEMIHAALNHAGASGFINALPQGIETNVGEMGSGLSGGQRQRISLARALVTNPKILILVEVTSALDPETEAKIVSKIASLRGRYTIVVITHRPAWRRIADRLYSLSKGHVSSPKKREKPKGAKK